MSHDENTRPSIFDSLQIEIYSFRVETWTFEGESTIRYFSNKAYLKFVKLILGLVLSSLLVFGFQNCGNSELLSPQIDSSQKSSGNGGVYGGMQPPDVPGSVKVGQTVVITINGGQGPFLQEYVIFNVELFRGLGDRSGCPNPGALQVYTRKGVLVREIPSKEVLCDRFGASISANDQRLMAGGIRNVPNGDLTWASRPGFVMYRINDQGQFEEEQVVISNRRMKWGWTDVGMAGDRAFLHYSSWNGTGSIIEIYKYHADNANAPWKLETTIDFSQNPYEQVSSYQVDSIGRDRVKFSDTDQTLFIRVYNKEKAKEFIKIYQVEDGLGYKYVEQIDLASFLPPDVMQLGTMIQVQSFQHRGNEIFMMISWASAGDRFTHERMIVLQKKLQWELLDLITPPNNGESYNERYHSSVGKDYFIVMNSTLQQLLVYKKVDGHYQQSYDLSAPLMKNGFARDALMRGSQIIIPFFFQVFVIDLK